MCLCMTRKDLTVNVIEKHIVMHYSSSLFFVLSVGQHGRRFVTAITREESDFQIHTIVASA